MFELPNVKNCTSRLCTGPFTHWWKQSFRVFGTGCDRPSARLETAQNVLSYPKRQILLQHPHSHPSKWVPRGHRVAKTANIPKVAEKCINCARPTPPHTNAMESGPGNSFSAQHQKNTTRFMTQDFDPKKRGSFFWTFLTPHPPPHPHTHTHPPASPSKPQKSGLQVGGVWGGPDQKLIGGCVYWTK